MSSQVFDIRTSKGMTRGQSNEHLRCFSQQAFEAKVSHNFDPSREQLNFEVKPGGIVTPLDKSDPIDARIKRSMKERGVKDPNEGLDNEDPRRVNSVIDIIFQGSRDRMRELAFGDQEIEENNGEDIPCNWHITRRPEIEEWAKDMYKFACDKFGEKNVAAFVVHLDELNPHAHCTILPIALKKNKGRSGFEFQSKKDPSVTIPYQKWRWLSPDEQNEYNKIPLQRKEVEAISVASFIGKNKHEARQIFLGWHDDLAEVNKKWRLERGLDVNVTGAKHRTTEQYWKWLSDRCSELEKKQDGLDKEVRFLETQKFKAQSAVKGLETMIANLNDKIEDLRVEISYLEHDTEENNESIREKEAELKRLQTQLDDKNTKLEDAQQRLWDLGGRLANAEERLETTERRINTIRPDLHNQVANDMQILAWNFVLDECSRLRQEVNAKREDLYGAERRGFDEYTHLFEDSFLEDISSKGEEIVAVASNLFLGYIDAATSFAAKSGGGGSGPSSGWGRKKDEDERSFMGRCLIMAQGMMKPAQAYRGLKR